jgi:hypothetical protein
MSDLGGTCTRCGRNCSPKRLTDLGPDDRRCSRCLDAIPAAERRALLRKAKEAQRVS